MSEMKSVLLPISVVLSILSFSVAFSIGQSCVGRLQLQGVCRAPADCKTSTASSFNENLAPVKCGFKFLRKIICCESEVITSRFSDSQLQTTRYRKCREYQSAVYTTQRDLQLSSSCMSSLNLKTSFDYCGFMAVPLIVGGTAASLRQFPHSALLGSIIANTGEVKWTCGGSLISRRFVLTAAHCLFNPDYGPLRVVRLGELDYRTDKDGAFPQNFFIAESIPHPKYNSSDTYYNDIALLKLDHTVAINPNIRPICLPVTDKLSSSGVATGWGAIKWKDDSNSVLRKVTLETFPQSECNTAYTQPIVRKLPHGIISSQMCAGSRSDDKDTCQGDSGGPFQIYHPTISCMYIQVGVTSFGRTCGAANTPGIYTRVSSYVEWIENIVWPDG